jgi:hypothetical protein
MARTTRLRSATSGLAALTLGVLAPGCGDIPGPGEGPDDVITPQGEIINGTTHVANESHVGALYHQKRIDGVWKWAPRPCSSKRLTADGWYLTARHCITETGTIDGRVVPYSRLKLTEALAPGLAPPPASAVAITLFATHPNPKYDIAMVYAPGINTVSFNQLGALWTDTTNSLVGKDLQCIGYGRYVFDANSAEEPAGNPNGAGILRGAIMHVYFQQRKDLFAPGDYGFYRMHKNASGQIPNHGDSGGGCFYDVRNGGVFMSRVHTGVHVEMTTANPATDPNAYMEDAVDSDFVGWVSQTIGRVYLKHLVNANSPSASRYIDVQWNNPANNTPVWLYGLTRTAAQHWTYDDTSKALKNANGKCLEVKSNGTANGTPVWMRTCTGAAAQQWTFGRDLSIRNANGKCLDVPNGAEQIPLQIYDCNGWTNQQWLFAPEP